MTEPFTPPEPAAAATPGAENLAMAGAATGAAAVAGAEVVAATMPPRRRRRRIFLLVLLLLLLGLVALFAGWYFVTRKPISEIPIIPPVTQPETPSYATSLYGATIGDLRSPTGVASTPDGSKVYVAQSGGDRTVLILDAQGQEIGALTPPAPASTGAGGGHIPVYVAVNPTTGDVYASDRLSGDVYIYSPEGVYRRTLDPGTEVRDAGWIPLGLGFGKDGSLYVTNLASPVTVEVFGPDGKHVRTITPTKDAFNFPNGVAVDANNNVYVTDSNNGRMRVFSPDGRELGGIPRGAREGDLGLPRGVAIDDAGRVFVVDTMAHGVNVYKVLGPDDRKPAYLGRFGVQGSVDGAFQFPNGISVDARGRVYVTDMANNRIQVWSY